MPTASRSIGSAAVVLWLLAVPGAAAWAQPIDLGDVAAGGDGRGTAPAGNTGVDPRTGEFVASYYNGRLFETDGVNPAPVAGSPYIDSVFIFKGRVPTAEDGCNGCFVQYITQSNVQLWLDDSEEMGSGWNFILKDRVGGVSDPGIVVGGQDNLTTSVGIHASMGITFDLEALRQQHGEEAVGCFNTFWGMDSCPIGFVRLMAMLSDDTHGVTDLRQEYFLADGGGFLQMEIPRGARYLTLAAAPVGNNDNCDHGTFAHATITDSPCTRPSLANVFRVEPSLVSTLGGTSVNIVGRNFSVEHVVTIDGLPLQNQELLSDTIIRGITPPLPDGFHTVEYADQVNGVEARLRLGVEAAPPPGIDAVLPHDVLADGSTVVEIRGRNFRNETFVEIGIHPLSDLVLQSSRLLSGRAPPLEDFEPLGSKQVLVADSRGFGLLDDGVAYVLPRPGPIVTSVSPGLVSTLGTTPVAVNGANFTPSTLIVLFYGGDIVERPLILKRRFVSSTRIEGVAPPLGNEVGFGPFSIVALDAGGTATIPGALTYLPPPEIASVSPNQVSTAGNTAVVVEGRNFTPATRIRFGGRELLSPQLEGPSRISGIAPPLSAGEPPGAKDVTADDGLASTTLAGGVTYIAPNVALTRVEPFQVRFTGGDTVVFFGNGLEGLRPRLGGQELIEATYRQGIGGEGNTITGFTPPLALGVHTADVIDAEGNVMAALARAVEVVDLPQPTEISLLGPEQIEGTLAEGKARFIWNNPVPAREILVHDELGTLLQRLPGNTNYLELPVPPASSSMKLGLVSIFDPERRSDLITAAAFRLQCVWPPPLMGLDIEGGQDLTITGDSVQGPPARCGAAPGGGEFAVVADLRALGVAAYRESSLDGGSVITNGVLERIKFLDPILYLRLSKRLLTGFTLSQDADQLQIDGFYSNPVYAFDLKLKGRLIHVFPEDGFEDQFTFPDIQPGVIKGWNGATYFRADRDVADTGAQPCGLKIPAGDYLLELYAVEGDADTPHFVFANDGRNEEILIKGVPCPPYPRVRITDLTGKRTLPIITQVIGQQVGTSNAVRFEAIGYWLDENSRRHALNPSDPSYAPHNFEFKWEIHATEPPIPRTETGRADTTVPVPQIGCYQVDVTVRDVACDRRSKRIFEVPIYPSVFSCDAIYYAVQNPSPSPGSVRGVVGFKSLVDAGLGNAPRHRESFRVFVMPKGCCGGAGLQCPAPQVEDIEFRLAARGALFDDFPVYTVPATGVQDLCPDVQKGPKYFQVSVNLDNVDTVPGADRGVYKEVFLSARVVTYRDPALGGAPRDVRGKDFWQRVGPPMLLTNRPDVLSKSFWSASYLRATGAYSFQLQSSRASVESIKAPDSNPLKFLQSLIDAEVPSFPSSLNNALNTGIRIVNGGPWEPEKALASMGGKVLGNQLDGAPLDAAVSKISGAIPEKLEWEWSDHRKIFEKHFEQKLFESIVWTGVIVIVPVTIWASIGIGFDFAIESDARVKIAPFAPLLGGNYFESDLGVTSKLDVSLPAELRTDVLFGVVSQSFSAIVSANSAFGTGIRARNTNIGPYLDLSVKLNVALLSKICLFWYLCYPQYIIPLLKDASIIDYHYPPGGGGLEPAEPEVPFDPFEPGAIAGGGGLDIYHRLYEELTNPAIGVSPDRNRTLSLYFSSLKKALTGDVQTLLPSGQVRNDAVFFRTPELGGAGPFDMSIAFLTKDRALIASNTTYPDESGLGFPFPADHKFSREELNVLKAQDEVVVSFGEQTFVGMEIVRTIRLSDPSSEVAAQGRRADGRPAMASSPLHQDAIVSWVRIDHPEYLVEEPGTTKVYHQEGQATLSEQNVPIVRPRLEAGAIYTRRVDFAGLLDAPRKISGPGINVEPAIAFSPTGNETYCVWVNDPIHTDLIGSNLGRNLVYAVWKRATDSWSAPRPVLAGGDDYPGVLEPSIALKGDGQGLLAFNAMEKGAPARDTGLIGQNRFVFTCRLVDGVFGPPVKIHGLCGRRVMGRYQTIHLPPLYLINPDDLVFKRPPDWVMVVQQTDVLGRPDSAGNVLVTALGGGQEEFAAPVALTKDGRTHTNVVGTVWNGGIKSVNLKGVVAKIGAAGGGIVGDEGYETIDAALDPDLALVSCVLSNQFAGAGAFVKAKIEVENRGLGCSATDAQGASLTSVRVIYLRVDGSETVEAEDYLPELVPGGRAEVEFDLEMPLDPVKLRAEVIAGPAGETGLDRDPTNNAAQCAFGAPQPTSFRCAVLATAVEGGEQLSGVLSWTNTALYDEVTLFRDGCQIATLPTGSDTFVDHTASPGAHLYEVRGSIGASRSCRTQLSCEIAPPPPPGGPFRRGDVDMSGILDITDAINLLGFLFLGGAEPPCPDSTDADDNGQQEITDAIAILGYLFLGGVAMPDPGPNACGADVRPDDLGPCRAECS